MKPPTSTNNLLDIFVGVDIGKSFHCAAAINRRPTLTTRSLSPALCATAILFPFNRAKKTPSNSSFCAGSGVLSAMNSLMPSVGSPD